MGAIRELVEVVSSAGRTGFVLDAVIDQDTAPMMDRERQGRRHPRS
jgi:hypothetical protein